MFTEFCLQFFLAKAVFFHFIFFFDFMKPVKLVISETSGVHRTTNSRVKSFHNISANKNEHNFLCSITIKLSPSENTPNEKKQPCEENLDHVHSVYEMSVWFKIVTVSARRFNHYKTVFIITGFHPFVSRWSDLRIKN